MDLVEVWEKTDKKRLCYTRNETRFAVLLALYWLKKSKINIIKSIQNKVDEHCFFTADHSVAHSDQMNRAVTPMQQEEHFV